MFNDPDYAIRWPPDLIADELEAVGEIANNRAAVEHVLEEAFVGRAILERYRERDDWGMLTSPPESLVRQIVEAARRGELHEPRPLPFRWKRNSSATSESTESDVTEEEVENRLRAAFREVLIELDDAGYLDQVAARPCAEDRDTEPAIALDNTVSSELGTSVRLDLPNRSAGEIGYYAFWLESLPQDDFYELMEVIHDLVARPRRRLHHDNHICGYHYSRFSIGAGRRLYRWKLNRLLQENNVPLRLAEDGEFVGRLMSITDDGRTALAERVARQASAQEKGTIQHAIDLFQRRCATREDKRSAVVALAGFLEEHRRLLKEELLSKDESALFHIANQFDMRHRNADQQSDYDEAYLDWMFWWYLSTVELIQQLLKRQT